jgi:hypothetical protein
MVVGTPRVVGVVDPEVVGVVDAAAVVVGLEDELLHAVRPRAATARTITVRVRARVMGTFLSGISGAGATGPTAGPPADDTVAVTAPFAVSHP